MTDRSVDVHGLILKIHAAPLEPDGWAAVGRDLCDLCGAEMGSMLRLGSKPGDKPWAISFDFDVDAIPDYMSYWAPRDLILLGAKERGKIAAGLVSTDDELVDRPTFLQSSYFNDYLRRYDVERHLNLCLTEPENGLGASAITLYRGVGEDSFSRRDAALLSHLAPHLAIAARTTWKIDSLSMRDPVYRRAIDSVHVPMLAVDAQGHIALINSAGEAIVRDGRWLRTVQGVLTAAETLHRSDRIRVKDGLARLRDGIGGTILVTDGPSGRQAVVAAVPIPRASPIHWPSVTIAGILWVIPCTAESSATRPLARLFELTRAEESLLGRLIGGEELPGAATSLGISIHTARNQLKSIFRKTGRRNQSQLLALAARMSAVRIEDDA